MSFKGRALSLHLFQVCVFFSFQPGVRTDAKKIGTVVGKLKHFHAFVSSVSSH